MKKTRARYVVGIACVMATVIMVTFLCHAIRFRPDQSERSLNIAYSGEVLSHYASGDPWAAALSPKAEVASDHGIGFRRMEIRQRPDQHVPKNITRHYLSTLGWPQPIVSSGSEWLGRYHESDLPMWALDDSVIDHAPMSGGPSTTLHWSGIIFNVITFGLPFLAVAMWVSRRASWSSLVLSRGVVIVAAAWWVGLTIPAVGIFDYVYCPIGSMTAKGVFPDFWSLLEVTKGEKAIGRPMSFYTTSPEEFSSRTGCNLIPLSPDGWRFLDGYEAHGFAVTKRTQRKYLLDPEMPSQIQPLIVWVESTTAGWPIEAFGNGDSSQSIFEVSDLSHLDVQWLPWLANVAMLSAMLLMVFYIPMHVFGRIRAARDHGMTGDHQLIKG